jgi:hypothetical protein
VARVLFGNRDSHTLTTAASEAEQQQKQMWRLGIASGMSPKSILQRIMRILKESGFV